MKRTGNHVIIINGDNNEVEVNVTITETSSNTPAATVIAIGAFAGAAVLAVSRCCPELLDDLVRWMIGQAIGG